MADITISDLELAPALADDMVFPVENTTDTYAATLAMLRRLINKTFVEMEDANFNDLTDDGFYQCTGTPTNSPEAGAINWTLQVSAESGVVVQRAFSLDDRFENFYIRRFNGVIWTAWKNMTNVVGTPFSLGDSRYFETAPYNASWLASNGQYNSSVIYPSMWGQLQVELSNISVGEVGTYNGYSYTKRGLPVVLSTDTIDDEDFVVNQNDQTFRLPLLNGEHVLVAKKEATTEDPTWFNWYSDGWCEQGGVYSFTNVTTSPQYVTIGLFKTMNSYSINICPRGPLAGDWGSGNYVIEATYSNSFSLGAYSFRNAINTVTIDWSVCGYASIPTQADFTEVAGLYYYIGDTVQDASLINAGAVLNTLSGKVGYDALTTVHCVVETYRSGACWYRVYDDGWIEQGGIVAMPTSGWYPVTFLKPFSDTNYTVVGSQSDISTASVYSNAEFLCARVSNTSMQISVFSSTGSAQWIACGKGA